MLYETAVSLREAQSLTAFVAACRAIVADSPHISLDLAAPCFGEVVSLAQRYRPVSWDWFLRAPDGPLEARWYDIVFSSAMNGGYFEKDAATGQVRQWASNGSGSQAMLEWVRDLRERGLLPGWDVVRVGDRLASVQEHVSGEFRGPDPRAEIDAIMAVHGAAYAAERRAIVEEFSASGAVAAATMPLFALRKGADGLYAGALGMREVDMLAHLLPRSFGGDPFRKKACLAVLLLTSHLAAHGHGVTADIPIPSDYQIPRILAWKGLIRVGDRLAGAMRAGRMLDARSEPVEHFRAAAVVAAHEIAAAAGVPDWAVDGALFNGFRRDQRFQEESLPPMRIHGMWF